MSSSHSLHTTQFTVKIIQGQGQRRISLKNMSGGVHQKNQIRHLVTQPLYDRYTP